MSGRILDSLRECGFDERAYGVCRSLATVGAIHGGCYAGQYEASKGQTHRKVGTQSHRSQSQYRQWGCKLADDCTDCTYRSVPRIPRANSSRAVILTTLDSAEQDRCL